MGAHIQLRQGKFFSEKVVGSGLEYCRRRHVQDHPRPDFIGGFQKIRRCGRFLLLGKPENISYAVIGKRNSHPFSSLHGDMASLHSGMAFSVRIGHGPVPVKHEQKLLAFSCVRNHMDFTALRKRFEYRVQVFHGRNLHEKITAMPENIPDEGRYIGFIIPDGKRPASPAVPPGRVGIHQRRFRCGKQKPDIFLRNLLVADFYVIPAEHLEIVPHTIRKQGIPFKTNHTGTDPGHPAGIGPEPSGNIRNDGSWNEGLHKRGLVRRACARTALLRTQASRIQKSIHCRKIRKFARQAFPPRYGIHGKGHVYSGIFRGIEKQTVAIVPGVLRGESCRPFQNIFISFHSFSSLSVLHTGLTRDKVTDLSQKIPE